MQETTNKVMSQQDGRILQLKRKLLPIAEYAAREGVSVNTIEKCGKFGILQVRKYKGETFVVDTPLKYATMTDSEPTQPIPKDVFAEKISELVRDVIPEPFEPDEQLTTLTDNVGIAENSTAEAQAILERTFEVSEEPTEQAEPEEEETIQSANLFGPIKPPDWDIFEIEEKHAKISDQAPDPAVKTQPRPDLFPQSRRYHYSDRTKANRYLWQIIAVTSTVFFISALVAAVRLYGDLQIGEQAIRYIQQGQYAGSGQTIIQAQTLQKSLEISNAELRRIQNELNSSKAYSKKLQDKLRRTRQQLETSRQRNIEAINQLDKQVQNLSAKFEEMTKNQ